MRLHHLLAVAAATTLSVLAAVNLYDAEGATQQSRIDEAAIGFDASGAAP